MFWWIWADYFNWPWRVGKTEDKQEDTEEKETQAEPEHKGARAAHAGLTERQGRLLRHWARCPTSPQRLVMRCEIVLLSEEGKRQEEIARLLGIVTKTVRKWQLRWREMQEDLRRLEELSVPEKFYRARVLEVFDDAARPGAPLKFSAEEVVQLVLALSLSKGR